MDQISVRTGKKYLLKRQKTDKRDKIYQPVTPPHEVDKNVDLRPLMPPVLDQGSLGTCAMNATVSMCQYLMNKEKVKSFLGSRLELYYNTRVLIEGSSANEDTGVELRDVPKSLQKYGLCPEVDWPYDVDKFSQMPPSKANKDAVLHKKITYEACPQDLTFMKQVLTDGYPILIGINVYDSFESEEVAKTGIVPMPDVDKENNLGGHALAVVGALEDKKCFIIRNSWGPTNNEEKGWGDGGYCYMPYEYLTNPDLSSDFWVIKFFE